jgi:ElaB/YqjD/DUF883 family membrane-anchored ribosome-binding protein
MADNMSTEEIRKEFDKQLADLRKEIGTLSRSIAAVSSEAYERTRDVASDALDKAKGQARGSLQQAREQTQLVADAVKENPGTAATVLSSAGILGFVLGLVVGATFSSSSRRW